jgi:hypothetical protein
VTIPKYQWEQKADFLLFEFYRDRSVFLMPSTRWGFVAIEKPEVGVESDPDDDRDGVSGDDSSNSDNASTLPVADWLRCKAGLKMGRPLWDVVGRVQRELWMVGNSTGARGVGASFEAHGSPRRSPRRTNTADSFEGALDEGGFTAEEAALGLHRAYKEHMKGHAVSTAHSRSSTKCERNIRRRYE